MKKLLAGPVARIVTGLFMFLGAFLAGRRGARLEAKLDAAEDYADTRKSMDAVKAPADADEARDRLKNWSMNR